MANPYASRKIRFNPGPKADPNAHKQADMWNTVGQWAPVAGAGIGAIAGGLAGGLPTGGMGALPGAAAGATLGGSLGGLAGGAMQQQGDKLLDPERECELRKQAYLEAISGLRGF